MEPFVGAVYSSNRPGAHERVREDVPEVFAHEQSRITVRLSDEFLNELHTSVKKIIMKNKKKPKIKKNLIFSYHTEEAIYVNKIRDIEDRVLRIV